MQRLYKKNIVRKIKVFTAKYNNTFKKLYTQSKKFTLSN